MRHLSSIVPESDIVDFMKNQCFYEDVFPESDMDFYGTHFVMKLCKTFIIIVPESDIMDLRYSCFYEVVFPESDMDFYGTHFVMKLCKTSIIIVPESDIMDLQYSCFLMKL